MGFDIESISSLEDSTLTQDLLPFVSNKRPTRAQRRSLRRPPLSTNCIVYFAPSPQGPLNIRSIAGGPHALYDFLTKEPLPLATLTTPVETLLRPTPITRSSSPQAPTRTKRKAAAHHTSPQKGGRNGRQPSSSSPRPTRRPHDESLKIILEEGDPYRESIPRQDPYTSMVPPTSPWNRLGRDMIGVHTPTG